jgi:hypothetical protein
MLEINRIKEARSNGIDWSTAFVIEEVMYHPENNSQFRYVRLYETKDLRELYENNIVKDGNKYLYIRKQPSVEIEVKNRKLNLSPIYEEYKIKTLENCLYWHNHIISFDLLKDGNEYKNKLKKILMEIKLEG